MTEALIIKVFLIILIISMRRLQPEFIHINSYDTCYIVLYLIHNVHAGSLNVYDCYLNYVPRCECIPITIY